MDERELGVTPRKLGYVPALDGVRAVAVVLVIALHAWGHPAGAGLGVDVFFVLSGFLITCLLLEENQATGAISLRAFYKRRILRILPAAYVYVAAALLASAAGVFPGTGGPGAVFGGAAAGIAYVTNVVIWLRGLGAVAPAFRHLWSLAEEEQFYLLWPLLLIALMRRARPWRGVVGVLLFVAAMSGVRQVLLWQTGASAVRLWYAPDTRIESIAVGCLAALSFHRGLVSDRLLRFAWLPGLLVCIAVVSMPPYDGRLLFAGPLAVFPIGCALVIVAIAAGVCPVGKPLSLPPVRGLGRISYGVYLWHYAPVIYWGTTGVPVAIVLAALSYRVVERPLLRRKELARGRPSAVVPMLRDHDRSPAASTSGGGRIRTSVG